MINKLIASTIPVLPKWFIRFFSGPYVAGETIENALTHVKRINNSGFAATIDILGEHTKDIETASSITSDYCELYKKINQRSLDCNLSIKPSHLGIDISFEIAKTNFEKIITEAEKFSNFLRFDMESSSYTDNTLMIYDHCLKRYSKVGVVLQAYLKRSISDIENIAKPGFNARICKGIYKENPSIAYQNSEEIRNNFLKMAETMIFKKAYSCYATHDQRLIDRILDLIKKHKLGVDKFEFQVLYGVPMNGRLEELIKNGYKVRVYVPYGPDWYDYSLRRLKENPDIAGYVLKNIFSRNSY
jgi:proline dehydrogenase